MHVRRFEHPTKLRFWEVYWDLVEIEVVSGAIGSNGRATRKELASPLACAEWLNREVQQRLAEGFEEVVPEVVKNQRAPSATPPPELLQRILDEPDEDQPRMVYADWLQAQGDPLGELIAVQLELARVPRWELPPKRLRDREESLLAAFRQRWLPGVRANITFVRGFAERVRLDLPIDRELLDRVVELCPLLRTLELAFPSVREPAGRPWERASARALRRLTGLFMGGLRTNNEDIAAFAGAPDLAQLDRLGIRSMGLLPSHLKRLADRPWRVLDVHQNNLGARGVEYLVACPRTHLRVLDIGSNGITASGLAALTSVAMPALHTLSLRRSDLVRTALPELARFPALRALDLSCNQLDPRVFAELALPALAELDLRETALDDAGLRKLVRAPFAAQLVVLDLAGNALADPQVLANAELPALRALNISGNPLASSKKVLEQALPGVRIIARARSQA